MSSRLKNLAASNSPDSTNKENNNYASNRSERVPIATYKKRTLRVEQTPNEPGPGTGRGRGRRPYIKAKEENIHLSSRHVIESTNGTSLDNEENAIDGLISANETASKVNMFTN